MQGNEIEELRVPFPDYTPEEQEKDARRLRLKRHAYMLKVDDEWAHFILGRQEDIKFYPNMKMAEVYDKIKENYPEYKPMVLDNKPLEDYLRDYKKRQDRFQLKIKFKEFERD